MANRAENRNIDFKSSSERIADEGDFESEDAMDRLEQINRGAEHPLTFRGDLARESEKLEAETEEQVDALRVNLAQDDDSIHNTRYGTGKIDDDTARERLADETEVGNELDGKGVNAVTPGRDDTSRVLRRRRPNTSVARAEDAVEGNLEEPRQEAAGERKTDEGTAA